MRFVHAASPFPPGHWVNHSDCSVLLPCILPSSRILSRICKLTFFVSRSCILSRISLSAGSLGKPFRLLSVIAMHFAKLTYFEPHPLFGCRMPHPVIPNPAFFAGYGNLKAHL